MERKGIKRRKFLSGRQFFIEKKLSFQKDRTKTDTGRCVENTKAWKNNIEGTRQNGSVTSGEGVFFFLSGLFLG